MAEKVIHGLLCWLPDFRELVKVELGQMEPCEPHEPPGRALVARGAHMAPFDLTPPLPIL